MDEHDLLAERFETHRARLRAIASWPVAAAGGSRAWLRSPAPI